MGKDYAFSGLVMKAQPWDKRLLQLMGVINEQNGTSFNACLLNYYPDGANAGISQHSDDERELGIDPVVVSVSLGDSCDFILKNKKDCEVVSIPLKDGDVLVMGAGCQKLYTHGIEKKVHKGGRISLTFRKFN
jgi:alkylated DNA repair dioxygenase AlkB